jgi:pSer/pThr/pTyr-binding forkhead associated (FHA) protein
MEVRLLVTNEKANAKQVRLGPETVVGRSSECNLRIPSGKVSRQHCIIRIEESRVLVRDLGSANGTEIDGVTIPPEIDVPVAPGSTMVVGPIKFVFEFTPEPPKFADEEEDLQSTTQDIPPIPLLHAQKVDDEDTKDYGPARSRQQRSKTPPPDEDEPDSGQLDLTEGQPSSPAALVGGYPEAPSDEASVASADGGNGTVFDGELSDRAREAALRQLDGLQGLESGTDLLAEDADTDSPPPAGEGASSRREIPKDPGPANRQSADANGDDDDDSALQEFFKNVK